MAKYVPDVKTQRWVIISSARLSRPHDDTSTQPKVCPFCEGNESLTPPELYRLGVGEKEKPGWTVRVVPNKYPITDMHEVIIHSPSNAHDDIEKLPSEQVIQVVTSYRDRYQFYAPNGQVLIFCNHGAHAGASLTHPHSQLVVVPKQINLDALSREPINNIVSQSDHFITYCPEFSQWPFEQWIAPIEEGTKFGDIKPEQLSDFARVLQDAIKNTEAIYNDQNLWALHGNNPFGYNFYISHSSNWFVRIIPRFVHRAGFELGTGLNVNIMDPTEAARYLREKRQ